jgi:hypothetical protein
MLDRLDFPQSERVNLLRSAGLIPNTVRHSGFENATIAMASDQELVLTDLLSYPNYREDFVNMAAYCIGHLVHWNIHPTAPNSPFAPMEGLDKLKLAQLKARASAGESITVARFGCAEPYSITREKAWLDGTGMEINRHIIIDRHPYPIATLSALATGPYEVMQRDLLELKPEHLETKVDLITTDLLFDGMTPNEMIRTLKNAHAILNPGGEVIFKMSISTPQDAAITDWFLGKVGERWCEGFGLHHPSDRDRTWQFTRQDWLEIGQRFKNYIMKNYYTSFPFKSIWEAFEVFQRAGFEVEQCISPGNLSFSRTDMLMTVDDELKQQHPQLTGVFAVHLRAAELKL